MIAFIRRYNLNTFLFLSIALFGTAYLHHTKIAEIDDDIALNIEIVIEHSLPTMQPWDFDTLPPKLVSSAGLPVSKHLPVRGIELRNIYNEQSWVACVPGEDPSAWYVFRGPRLFLRSTRGFGIEIPSRTQWRADFLKTCLGEAL